MKTKLKNAWEHIHTSFWFLPALMAVASVLCAAGGIYCDKYLLSERALPDWLLYEGDLEGARSILTTIAASMITVAGVTFSITIVALTLAFSQLGPRLLRNFMRDKKNQAVLGAFVADYLYCLIILHSLQKTEEAFIPHLSLMGALILGITGLGMLIYFIHHISISIQADQAIALVCRDLEVIFKKHFADNHHTYRRQEPPGTEPPLEAYANRYAVCIPKSGYIEDIDMENLVAFAQKKDGVIKLDRRPGNYSTPQKPLLHLYTHHDLADEDLKPLQNCFVFRNERASERDIEFAVNQLVEIALRALSSGINDPFTAMACIDRLATALILFIENEKGTACIIDSDDRLRVMEERVTFEGITDTAYNQIRQIAAGRPSIVIRLLERIRDVLLNARTPHHKEVLAEHAAMIKNSARPDHTEPRDLRDIEQRYQAILEAEKKQ